MDRWPDIHKANRYELRSDVREHSAGVRIPVRVSGALKARRNPQLIYIVALLLYKLSERADGWAYEVCTDIRTFGGKPI